MTRHHLLRPARLLAAGVSILGAAACASSNNGGPNAPTSEPLAARPDLSWRVSTRYQVDLWLHGYALVQDDTTLVPYFKRGYRDAMQALKKQSNITTQLDTHRDSLNAGLKHDAKLVNGQFLGLYFRSWESMQKTVDSYLKASVNTGDNSRGRSFDAETRSIYGVIAGSYATNSGRDWLKAFTAALEDEDVKYYANYWRGQQTQRAPILAAVDSLWTKTYFEKFRPFLTKSGQSRGEILLSLPLDGEGRTLGEPGRGPTIAVSFPDSVSDAVDAMYVLAHEAVSTVSNKAVDDNTTPAEKREGVADKYTSAAAVRGGYLLLQKVAPELATGYARYYLNTAKISFTEGDEANALEQAFPLRKLIQDQLVNDINKDTTGS